MNREDWLLVFLGLPGGPHDVDQIRAMKGMFLLAEEGGESVPDLYDFDAYDYGPFDSRVYADLDALESNGLASVENSWGNRRVFKITAPGQERVSKLTSEIPADALERLKEIRSLVSSMTFTELLRHVYAKYPQYAINSRARL